MDGISAPVRIVRDRWGVPHIFATTRDDLFFAQGFVQAEDRLFQMDLWRRSVQGRLSEVLGANFVGRDAMTRRIQHRGNLEEEWASYGPDAKAIASAFVRGVNAWIAIARKNPPDEFRLAGWEPEVWRPEDLLNRTDAFLASADAQAEVFRARLIGEVGAARAAALLGDEAPGGMPAGVDLTAINFQVGESLSRVGTRPFFTALSSAAGSNAWAIAAPRSETGSPIVATDPHRLLSNPSIRYLVHLSAPGWSVIGAASPWMPGVVIGHNENVAWATTSFAADIADLYVERVNPENSHQVEQDGRWRNTRVIVESIAVKGSSKPTPFEIEYTPHGVVIGLDRIRHLAFTLRWSGAEPGAAAELGALALDQATSAAGMREALTRWKLPIVEVVYADKGDGTIGSQVAGLLPTRQGWDGRLPIAGWTGGTEWNGWRTIDDLPHATDTAPGYVASANASRARIERIRGVLSAPRTFSIADSVRLQRDVRAWNGDRLVPLFARVRSNRDDVEQLRERILRWDHEVSLDSVEAAVYVTWERLARRMLIEQRVPGALVEEFDSRRPNLIVLALLEPSRVWFDGDVVKARDDLVLRALEAAADELKEETWRDGQKVVFAHPLAINDAGRRRFNLGPFNRAGYAETVMSMSGRRPDATVGASFSAVFDLANWDRSLAQNAPGQSERPESPHFGDLGKLWADGAYFPLAFSEKEVAANAHSTLMLTPRK